RRAHEAIQKGVWKDQIIPIEAWKYVKDKNGQWIRTTKTFDMDDGVRWPSTMEGMAKLKSPFKQGGSVTAANSSQMTDGAAFSMIMSAEKAKELKLKPIAKLTHYAVAGNNPEGPLPPRRFTAAGNWGLPRDTGRAMSTRMAAQSRLAIPWDAPVGS
ncbi:MAG: hypothetical protein JRC53_05045, partial [Deltaproteobacteria bacterium]|nr:hypothetical protein [Deltaproteobacteria bacterium]